MPGRLLDFICYWRSRGLSIKAGYRLWTAANSYGKTHLTPGDVRWATRES